MTLSDCVAPVQSWGIIAIADLRCLPEKSGCNAGNPSDIADTSFTATAAEFGPQLPSTRAQPFTSLYQ
ncbi:MAG: hypothetical protein EBE86_005370 [Hormoscilla sp. GUM202]|nr:hypothetical protein [Hormoscilla sp. GUM202]